MVNANGSLIFHIIAQFPCRQQKNVSFYIYCTRSAGSYRVPVHDSKRYIFYFFADFPQLIKIITVQKSVNLTSLIKGTVVIHPMRFFQNFFSQKQCISILIIVCYNQKRHIFSVFPDIYIICPLRIKVARFPTVTGCADSFLSNLYLHTISMAAITASKRIIKAPTFFKFLFFIFTCFLSISRFHLPEPFLHPPLCFPDSILMPRKSRKRRKLRRPVLNRHLRMICGCRMLQMDNIFIFVCCFDIIDVTHITYALCPPIWRLRSMVVAPSSKFMPFNMAFFP